MDLRELKAIEIAARAQIPFRDGAWIVPGQVAVLTASPWATAVLPVRRLPGAEAGVQTHPRRTPGLCPRA
jgi:hypothetical protein